MWEQPITALPLVIDGVPALLYGNHSDAVYLFVHGKCGQKEEAAVFAQTACPKGWQVLSIDLPEHGERAGGAAPFAPWQAVPELQAVMKYIKGRWRRAALRANSIGAWFSMQSFAGESLEKCLFVSPLLDMEQLIGGMMQGAGVSEEELREKGEIPTAFGETLSWRYLLYARENPIRQWSFPTAVLYAGRDNLTSRDTVDRFVRRFSCSLTVLEDGEHWFHTPEQMEALKKWSEQEVAPAD
ncbi:MAG: alpha/beta hydrolase [Oscillospiraceae bacterium]|nr:alpha/beta hydrolase [Oscillospiraceae bacterium]